MNGENNIKNAGKLIAFTFDDGPNNEITNLILDTVEKYKIKATFFLIADNISDETKPTVQRALDLGCEIENHSKTHSYMDKLSAEEIRAEVEYTDKKIAEITGVVPRFFRPPYIAVKEEMFDVIDKTFICGLGSQDWEEGITAEYVENEILRLAEDGAIMLLHDFEGNHWTPEAVKNSVPKLLEQGYEFVTLGELFERKGIVPDLKGVVYSRAGDTELFKVEEQS